MSNILDDFYLPELDFEIPSLDIVIPELDLLIYKLSDMELPTLNINSNYYAQE